LPDFSKKQHFPTLLMQNDIEHEIENFYEDNKSLISEINREEFEGEDYFFFTKKTKIISDL
jgi:hypothetical protein